MLRNSPRAMPLTGSNLPHSVVEEGIIHKVFSLGRSHVSDRGERSREARARTERGRGVISVCSVIVRATKRRRRKFSLVRCHVSDRGERKPGGPSSRKKGRGVISVCSVRVRATKRRRRKFSLGRSHVSDRGERKPRGPKLAQKKMTWSHLHVIFFCASEGTRTHTHEGTRS